ncbi:MAG: CHAT domain-containing protein, partial [Planctomycetes bacterium]|nr:CHAT domain-containing protein [Planctomycetota bacterium]
MERTYRVLGRELRIHLGDITQLEVDAIVSSENSDLIMDQAGGASVSGAIRTYEGDAMAATLTRLGPIEPGQAVVTPASALPANWVVHAAAVVKTEAGHWTTLEILRGAVRSSLSLAAGLGLESIAFPAFGVRATNIGIEASCQAMVDEIVAFLRRPSSLQRVVIALLDPGAFLEFFEAALRRGALANAPLTLRVGAIPGGFTVAPSGGPSAPVARVFSASLPPEGGLERALTRLRAGATRRLRDLDRELAALGRTLWESLPEPVQAALREERGRPLRLELDEAIAWLPLELAYDGTAYLAERTVSRHLVSRAASSARVPSSPQGPLPMLIAAGDPTQLPASLIEARELVDLLWRRAGSRVQLTLLAGSRATREAIGAAFPKAALIHWCGHTRAVGEDNPEPAWELSNGLWTTDEVGRLPLAARLVVLNSCGRLGGVGLPRAFLLAGAQNVIGSLWDVEDAPARAFATAFYEALCLGKTIGNALTDARAALRPLGAIHWLAYQHWGDPSARLFEPRPL